MSMRFRVRSLCILAALVVTSLAPVMQVAAMDIMPSEETLPPPVTPEATPESAAPAPVAPSVPVDSPTTISPAESPKPSAVTPQPAASTPSTTVPVTQPPVYAPPKTPIIISAFQTTNALGFVEIYNSDTVTIKTKGWRVEAVFTNGASCSVPLGDALLAKGQALLVRRDSMTTTHALSYDCGSNQQIVKTLNVYNATNEIVESLAPPIGDSDPQVWQRKGLTATSMRGNFANDFKELARPVVDGEWHQLPAAPTLTIIEVLVNPRSCTVPDEAIDCYDYVKVVNSGPHEIDLANYRLRSGYSNAAVSSSNMAYLSGTVPVGAMALLRVNDEYERLSLSANDGTVWFEDSEGLETFAMNVPPYVNSDLTSKKGLSWALDPADGAWKWGIPSPLTRENRFPAVLQGNGAAGVLDELKPCAANQFRSPETNRCRLIASVDDALKPCRDGQYRSEETNRCRSIASAAAAVLKPCADNQFRNPATNRCKSIASVDDVSLADCGEGRERNPTTNRCRNVQTAAMPAASFPVETVKESGKAFIGWWALGGVGIAAAGYAAWEWRREMAAAIKKLGTFFTFKK